MKARKITDPGVLKGMTHPFRRSLYRLLTQLGPANVTVLVEHTGADPGRVSYHLRELAKVGFIEQVPELARDGRETWWRTVGESWSWSSDTDDPADRAISEALYQLGVAEEFERLRHYEASRDEFAPEWRNAAQSSQTNLRLTAAELSELSDELNAVLRRWTEVGRIDPPSRPEDRPEDGRENVFVFLHAFPEKP